MMMMRYFVNWAPGYATVAAAAELSQTRARSPLPCTQDVGVAKLTDAERIRQFSRHTPSAVRNLSVKGKKVKFSHTRYRALGPELIPVYRQSARR